MPADTPKHPPFGAERRWVKERRAKPDRREMFRWEPDKPERRNGDDRRTTRRNADLWGRTHRR